MLNLRKSLTIWRPDVGFIFLRLGYMGYVRTTIGRGSRRNVLTPLQGVYLFYLSFGTVESLCGSAHIAMRRRHDSALSIFCVQTESVLRPQSRREVGGGSFCSREK